MNPITTHSSKRVALLNSPYLLNEPFFQQMPPLSLLYLGAALKEAGHGPQIFNLDCWEKYKGAYYFGFDLRRLFSQLDFFQPDLIGITCPYSARWPFTQRLTRLLRNHFPATPIVIGGIHPTSFPEYCLESSEADFIVIGEGEHTIVELLSCLGTERSCEGIDGLAYQSNGACQINPKTRFIKDLDALSLPAYDLLDMEHYRRLCRKDRISQMKGLYFSLLTSRQRRR